ncbi:tRNA lysidine(34) synthetase TilS [Corynebacterium frankenforstense]
MPRALGEVPLPHDPPAFGRLRVAVRRHLRAFPIDDVARETSRVRSTSRAEPAKPAARAKPATCGLSGGPDSTALLAALLAEGLAVEAVVVDHGLQAGSAEVAERAAATARRMGATARVVRVDARAGAGPGGAGAEAAARDARYRALAQASAGRPCFIAHTREDQAETYLLGALRGNPAGMPERGPDPADPDHELRRPLLAIARADTAAACVELGLEPWTDPQNSDPAFRRVRVRGEVLPLLDDLLGGASAGPLAAAAARVAADSAALEDWARRVDATDTAALAAVPAAVRTRALAHLVRNLGGRVNAASLSDLDRLVTDWHGQGPVDCGGGLRLARRAGCITEV